MLSPRPHCQLGAAPLGPCTPVLGASSVPGVKHRGSVATRITTSHQENRLLPHGGLVNGGLANSRTRPKLVDFPEFFSWSTTGFPHLSEPLPEVREEGGGRGPWTKPPYTKPPSGSTRFLTAVMVQAASRISWAANWAVIVAEPAYQILYKG